MLQQLKLGDDNKRNEGTVLSASVNKIKSFKYWAERVKSFALFWYMKIFGVYST